MTKKEMIKTLIKEWVKSEADNEARKERFIIHDSIEAKIDREWSKGGVEYAFDKFNAGEWNIERAVAFLRDKR